MLPYFCIWCHATRYGWRQARLSAWNSYKSVMYARSCHSWMNNMRRCNNWVWYRIIFSHSFTETAWTICLTGNHLLNELCQEELADAERFTCKVHNVPDVQSCEEARSLFVAKQNPHKICLQQVMHFNYMLSKPSTKAQYGDKQPARPSCKQWLVIGSRAQITCFNVVARYTIWK